MPSHRSRPLVGARIRRRRRERSLTLAQVAEATGLNVGYLSPGRERQGFALAGDAGRPGRRARRPDRLVPAGSEHRPSRRPCRRASTTTSCRRARRRSRRSTAASRATSRSSRASCPPATAPASTRIPATSTTWCSRAASASPRARPWSRPAAGDYVLLDGTLPHDAEALGDGPARLLIIYPRGGHSELTRTEG